MREHGINIYWPLRVSPADSNKPAQSFLKKKKIIRIFHILTFTCIFSLVRQGAVLTCIIRVLTTFFCPLNLPTVQKTFMWELPMTFRNNHISVWSSPTWVCCPPALKRQMSEVFLMTSTHTITHVRSSWCNLIVDNDHFLLAILLFLVASMS